MAIDAVWRDTAGHPLATHLCDALARSARSAPQQRWQETVVRRTRVQASWDEFRYGAGWRPALVAAAVLIGLAAFALAMPIRNLSPEPWAERQKRTEAECVARGSQVVQLLFPERGRGDRVCYGG